MCSTCCWTASRFDAATELPRTAITIRILATVVQWIELSPPKGVIQVRFLSGAPKLNPHTFITVRIFAFKTRFFPPQGKPS